MWMIAMDPIKVAEDDVVGYIGEGEFIILNPARDDSDRNLPVTNPLRPEGIPCKIVNNQVIHLGVHQGTLHDIHGNWYYALFGAASMSENDAIKLRVLLPNTFFVISGRK